MNEIQYKGQALPIHFGIRAIKEFATGNNLEFAQALSAGTSLASLDFIGSLAVFGLNLGARKSGSDKRYDEDEVMDMFEEEPELIYKVTEIFTESVTAFTDRLGEAAPKKEEPTAIE